MTIDTPDFQRASVPAESLLGVIETAGGGTIVVTPPANCPGLMVLAGGSNPLSVSVVGVTSGRQYPVSIVKMPVALEASYAIAQISTAVDASFTVTATSYEGAKDTYITTWHYPWAVYDTATGQALSVNGSFPPGWVQVGGQTTGEAVSPGPIGIDIQSRVLTVPMVPMGGAGNHPYTELSYIGVAVDSTVTVLAAPGAGARYRIFAASIIPYSGVGTTTAAYLTTLAIPDVFLACGSNAPNSVVMPPQGLALPDNTPVSFAMLNQSGSYFVTLIYTQEAI